MVEYSKGLGQYGVLKKILQKQLCCREGEVFTTSEVVDLVGLSQQGVSKNLKRLVEIGVIDVVDGYKTDGVRVGFSRRVVYKINFGKLLDFLLSEE